MDPAVHAEFTGAPAKISEEAGSMFEAFGGLLKGRTLQVVKSRLIIQSWRSVNFAEGDPDSTLITPFTDNKWFHLATPASALCITTTYKKSRPQLNETCLVGIFILICLDVLSICLLSTILLFSCCRLSRHSFTLVFQKQYFP
jgi:hypothetical protein